MRQAFKIQLYDNTLRDGEQTAGVCFSPSDKLEIAQALAAAGIRSFEAGFAGVSAEECLAIRSVMHLNLPTRIFSLARLSKEDIDAACRAGVDGVTLIAPASDALLCTRGIAAPESVEQEIGIWVAYAKQKKIAVKFSCVDATRTPLARLLRWYRAAQLAGADMISVADTVGVGTPESISRLIRELKRVLDMPVSMHAHNDLGLAVANSLAAAAAGADEVQVTVNGLGERAGNTALEAMVMALKVGYGLELGVDLRAMMALSETVARLSGREPGINQPIVGRDVFRHESGIHVQGLLHEDVSTYEPFPPEWIGRKHDVVFGKHSGKSNVQHVCREYGICLNAEQETQIVQRIKQWGQAQKRELHKGEVLQLILKPWQQLQPA
jgi:isopropylmalate/homocitrate/citramalate synthase